MTAQAHRMTCDIDDLIHSPLERTLSAGRHTLQIYIYRGAAEPDWILEIEDEQGTSSVFDERFVTDQAALDAALQAIEADGGIHGYCARAQAEVVNSDSQGLTRFNAMEQEQGAGLLSALQLMQPLSDEELDELEHFLVFDMPIESECMTLDMLDGYLHALAIGPETVMPSRWLPRVWGQDEGDGLPSVENTEQANRMLGLVLRHFNAIVTHFKQHPHRLRPLFGSDVSDEGEYEDAGLWAQGFLEGVKLSHAAWQPLLRTREGQRWWKPLQLLGDDDVSTDQLELLATKAQILALNRAVVDSVLAMHAYWLPLRQAVAERRTAQAMSTKVGRNEPCPCGSGRKFKKCCGSPAELH